MADPAPDEPPAEATPSSPMAVPIFRALWIAAAISNIGTWMQDVGQGWLMTSLTASPFLVSLVSASLQLPGVVLALPAGVLADLADRRRLLLFTQSFMAVCAATLAVLTGAHRVTPVILLICTAAMGMGSALNSPAWYAALPDVVPRALLPRAVVWNGVAWNVARAVGPALGGLVVSLAGPAAAFVLNALSFLATLSVLWRWPSRRPLPVGPPERFSTAIVAGVRYFRHSRDLRAVVSRTAFFAVFAASTLALLPLIARTRLHGGPSTYGLLLGCIGTGAISGAALLGRLRRIVRSTAVAPLGMALLALSLLGLARSVKVWQAAPALVIYGLGWLLTVSSLNTAAQLAVPVWVRARGLAIYLLTFSGAMAAGAAGAGHLAAQHGIPLVLLISAAGLAAGVIVSAMAPLTDEGSAKDLSAQAWAEAPRVEGGGRGPVIVIVRYPLAPDADRQAASAAVRRLASIRLRDGATEWRLYEDAGEAGVLVEVFSVASWEEHLRQHERGTVHDRQVLDQAEAACGGGRPQVVHLVAAP